MMRPVSKAKKNRAEPEPGGPFHYVHKGMLATIGRRRTPRSLWPQLTDLAPTELDLLRLVNSGERAGSLLLHPRGVRPGLAVDELVSLANPDHPEQPVIPPGNPS